MNKKIIIKNIIFILIFIIFAILDKKKDNINYFEDSEIFINNKKNHYLKNKYVKYFNKFINFCINDKLNNQIKYPLIRNPKISIIMPIYNGGKYLYYSLRSIQNQKIKEIEIVLIDDCSTDDSLNIIEKYMEEDPRIKLIKNKKNRKILYSKSIAALNSNGKYIIELDQDDLFIRDDCFNILYYEAELNDLDLVQIRDISNNDLYFKYHTQVNNNNHLIFPQNTNYKTQPMLKYKIFIENNIYLLWGLLIKSDLYKNAIYHLWPVIMNYQLIFHEDYAISFMIVIYAKRYKYINKFAILHLFHKNSASNNYTENKNYYLSVLFVSHIIYDYHLKNNPLDIRILFNYIYLFFDCFKYGKKYFPDLFMHIIKKIINDDNLSYNEKFKILNKIEYKTNIYYNYENKSFNSKNIISNFQNSIYVNNNTNYSTLISIIIYCNEYNFLNKTINSLLSQKFKNIEVLMIYDSINDDNLSNINNVIKNYKFIKLIDNKEIRGLIYSISIGIISCKGNYILFLQPGYTLSNEKILNELYELITNNNLDILEFDLLINKNDNINYNNLNIYKCSHMKSYINLDSIKYNKLNKEIDQEKELLFNKLIKTSLLRNIINEYKLFNYKDIIYNYYDDMILFCLMKKEIKIEHFNTIGMLQNINDLNKLKLINLMKDKTQMIKDTIFYINFLFENTDESKDGKKYALNEFYNVLSILFNKFNNISIKSIKLLEKFNNSNLINNYDKEELNFYYHSLIN
jgi:glycosyltransferase involved in cell wall biosynthesis